MQNWFIRRFKNVTFKFQLYYHLVLIKDQVNCLKDNIFECFFEKYNRLEEENIIKHIRNLFRPEKETKIIKDRMLRNIKNISKHEKEEEN